VDGTASQIASPPEVGVDDPLGYLNGLFGDRYRFHEEVGRGGLGVVYHAEDLRYHRDVAVKVLWVQEAGKKAAQRFLREIEIAARLSHPNIIPIFDSGARDGVSFFVMPLAEGGALRDRLEREGPLPVRDAIRMASEVLEALRCAHGHGVIHLDVKPENVLLSPDHALLADFGISRVSSGENPLKWSPKEGTVGTATYMAPEQASKKRRPDPRSDLYSVGCVLYEMLSGVPPFRGVTAQAVLKKHLTENPFPLTTRSTVSPELDQIVRKALEKEAGDRFQDANTFLLALQDLASPGPISHQEDRGDTAGARPPGWRTVSPTDLEREQAGEAGPAVRTSGEANITVWVVEDVSDTRADVKNLIDSAEGMACPKAVGSGEALIEALRSDWAPDVVIMDIGLPGMTGIEATSLLKRSWPGTEVIMLTVHEDFDRVFQAFQAGAISYLDKSASDGEILRAIRVAPRGGSVMTPPIARRFLSMFKQVQSAVWAYQLSPEDVDVLSGLVGGKGMEEIGEHLGLGPDDLEARLRMVHAKLHVNHAFPPK
jgi:serine/threonine protein kinase